MSLVTCARPGCGLTAATVLLVDGRRVAAVCSERCGYELIGPKRSAEDDARAEHDAEHQRTVAQREKDKLRFSDMAKMAAALKALSELRSRAISMEPLQVAAATLAIGRRIASGGADLLNRIDAVILDVVTAINHIMRDEVYQLPNIRQALAKLRNDIAADEKLDKFDKVTDFALKKAGVPDDVRQLSAYRANPIEAVAKFYIPGPYYPKSFFEPYDSNTVCVNRRQYAPDGTALSYMNASTQTYNSDFRLFFGHKDDMLKWNQKMVSRGVEVSRIDNPGVRSMEVSGYTVFVTHSDNAGLFDFRVARPGDYDTSDVLYTRFNPLTKNYDPRVALHVDPQLIPDVPNCLSIAIDAAGYIWVIGKAGLFVFDTYGVSISKNTEDRPTPLIAGAFDDEAVAVAAASNEGVWVCRIHQSMMSCVKYRMPSDDVYNAGPQRPQAATGGD